MKILVVDDNEDSRMILRKTLENDGYAVKEASDGAEALTLAEESPPDMIISDILMPVMDGFRLCREVKHKKQLRKIPFIFYSSAYVDPKDEKLAMSMGASRFILKPIEIDEFLNILKEVLQEYKEDRLYVPRMPLEDESELFRMYEESIVKKLDEKVTELRLYREVFSNSHDAIAIIDPEGLFIKQNSAHRALIGYPEEELRGKTPAIHLGEEVFSNIMKKLSLMGVFRGELISYTNAGKEIHIDLSAFPVINEKGAVRCYVEIIRDVTERKHEKQEKEKLRRQLIHAQKMESVSRLADGIAHDLNNIMTGIIGHAELAMMKIPEDDPVKKNLVSILKGGENAAGIIRRLLAFSRKQVMEMRPVGLNSIVEGTVPLPGKMIGEDPDMEIHTTKLTGKEVLKKSTDLPRGTETILIVDDEPLIREMIVDTLEPLGYRCLEASCGSEALHSAETTKERIDLLLTDVMMSGMSGRELADTLRAKHRVIKILFMSGYPDDYITRQGMLKPGIAYIPKPFSPSRLARKIREVLGIRIQDKSYGS